MIILSIYRDQKELVVLLDKKDQRVQQDLLAQEVLKESKDHLEHL